MIEIRCWHCGHWYSESDLGYFDEVCPFCNTVSWGHYHFEHSDELSVYNVRDK